MEVVLVAVTGVLCVVCLLFGVKIGQAVSKGERVEMPTLNPLKAYREHQSRKEIEREQDKMSKVLRNIERYDGTSRGQEDVG
jgi:hypothetical protein